MYFTAISCCRVGLLPSTSRTARSPVLDDSKSDEPTVDLQVISRERDHADADINDDR
jgi:hypothetical protein